MAIEKIDTGRVIDLLEENGEMTVHELAGELGEEHKAVHNAIVHLKLDQKVYKVPSRSVYENHRWKVVEE